MLRLVGMALLLLALSPVTAPFSTCDLIDLLGGRASHGGAVVQSKPTPDEPVAAVAPVFERPVADVANPAAAARSTAEAGGRRTFHIQLRI